MTTESILARRYEPMTAAPPSAAVLIGKPECIGAAASRAAISLRAYPFCHHPGLSVLDSSHHCAEPAVHIQNLSVDIV